MVLIFSAQTLDQNTFFFPQMLNHEDFSKTANWILNFKDQMLMEKYQSGDIWETELIKQTFTDASISV